MTVPMPAGAPATPTGQTAHDYAVSLIRTIVPVLVGTVLGALASAGLELDGSVVIPAVTGLATVGYYAIVRALEARHAAAGVLLGAASPPRYAHRPVSALAGMPATLRTMGADLSVTIVDQPEPRQYLVRLESGELRVVAADVITLRG